MKRVLVEVTHQVWVDVVEMGPGNEPLDVTQEQAVALVERDLAAMDWGGYSMLGKALRNLNPWFASSISVAGVEQPTMGERLRERSAKR